MQERESISKWLFAIGVGVPVLLVVGALSGVFDRAAEDTAGTSQVASVDSPPPGWAVDECNRFAEDGAASGAPNTGASDPASDAADERYAAGTGSLGSTLGMSERVRQNAKARAAYRDCMARNGYMS